MFSPFGGIQVILVGDFYQLPPIKSDEFVFESEIFKKVINQTIELTDIKRQSDKIFQDILNNVRVNKLTQDQIELLDKRTYEHLELENPNIKEEIDSYEIKPTKIYTLKKDVKKINDDNLTKLGEEIKVFVPETTVEPRKSYVFKRREIDMTVEIMDNNSSYEPCLKLCVKAQVMLIINDNFEKGLVNGSRGVITDFDSKNNPIVKFHNGETSTISKHGFEYNDDIKGKIIRSQYPLKLAWCITVHKSQGMSIDLAEIDIGKKVFEYGQSYVALSRVRNLEGLFLIKFDPTKIKCHPKVDKFFNEQSTNKKKPNNIINQLSIDQFVERLVDA